MSKNGGHGASAPLPTLRLHPHLRILAARCARGLHIVVPPTGGSRECRMRAAPAVSCAKAQKKAHTSVQGSGGNPTFPAQWLYGLFRAHPGVSGFPAPVASRNLALRPGRAFVTSVET